MKVSDYLLIYRDRHVFYPLRHGDGQIWTATKPADAYAMATRVNKYAKKDYKIASVISFEEEYNRIFQGEYPTLICGDDGNIYPVTIV